MRGIAMLFWRHGAAREQPEIWHNPDGKSFGKWFRT